MTVELNKTTKPRTKKITLKSLEKKFNEVSKMQSYLIDTETNEAIKYYEKFDNKKIEELFKELTEALKHDEENELHFFIEDEMSIQYILFLVIKKFTDLGDIIPNDLSNQIPIFEKLVSIGLYEKILNEVLDPSEVSRVLDKFVDFTSLVPKLVELGDKAKNDMLDTVESDVIKNKLKQVADVDA